MTDVSAFRDHQARTTLIMERERINEARRLALEELRQNVNILQRDNHLRQERLDTEQAHFTQKQSAQESKIAAKEHAAQTTENQVNALIAREDELRTLIQKTENSINEAVNEVNRRRQIQLLLAELQNDVELLRNVSDEKESDMMRLETQLARMEMSTEKRHTQLQEALPEYPLPQMDHDKMRAMLAQYTQKMNNTNSISSNGYNYDSAAGLEGMSNESILLVDDTMTNINTNNVSNSYYNGRTDEGAAVADNSDDDDNNDNDENGREHNNENNDEYNNEDEDEEEEEE